MRLLALGLVTCFCSELTVHVMPTPSEEHEIVMRDVGEWTVKGKMMMPQGMQDFTAEEQ